MSTQPQMMPPAKRDSLLPVKDGKRPGYEATGSRAPIATVAQQRSYGR